MPKRFSTDVVSIVCRAGTSTRSKECSGLKGIVVVKRPPKASAAEGSSRYVSWAQSSENGEKSKSGVWGRGIFVHGPAKSTVPVLRSAGPNGAVCSSLQQSRSSGSQVGVGEVYSSRNSVGTRVIWSSSSMGLMVL